MSTHDNVYEDPYSGHPDAARPASHPPPPDYDSVLLAAQHASVEDPPAYHIGNPGTGMFSNPTMTPSPGWTYPKETALPPPYSTNTLERFQPPPPMYNPELQTPQIAALMAPKYVALPRPMVFSSPELAMNPGMMPPLPHAQNFAGPGAVFINTVPPMVVTSHTNVIPVQIPPYNDYLPWSICNTICCCLVCGIVALVFSLQTQSAKRSQDWEAARKNSRIALTINLAALLVGIALTVIIPSVLFFPRH